MMSWLFIAVAILVLIALIPVLSAFKISSIKLMSGSIRVIQPSDIPNEQVEILIEAEKFFVKMGFVRLTHVTRAAVINGHDWGLFGVLFHDEDSNTLALAFVEPSGFEVLPWKCIFMTNVENKTLVTVNAEENDTDLSELSFVINDPLVCSTAEQWQVHQKSLKGRVGLTLKSDLKDILEDFETVYFQGLVETNTVVPYKGGYRYTFKDSLSVWKRHNHIQKMLASKDTLKGKAVPSEKKITTSAQREVVAYNAFKNVQDKNKTGWLGKTIFLLVSVFLFGVSVGVELNWEALISLIVVLFIHETGHLLGMWMFGYKDLRMLFIPFLGALASGKKENVTAFQESVVLLLGPMPGYVLGLAIIFGGTDEIPIWLVQYAIISIILNGLNLLPFLPLDGGRIVSLALFNRLPLLQLLLMILSILGFLYVGIFIGEWVLLILATLLIIGLPTLWREIQLFKYLLQQKFHEQSFNTKQLIETLHNHKVWQAIAQPNKWPLIDSLSYRVQHANASFSVRALIFGLWLAVIILPMYVALPKETISTLIGIAYSDQYSVSVEDKIDNYNEANSETERARFAIEISLWLTGQEEGQALFYWNKAKEHIISDDILDSDRATYYSQLAGFCSNYEPEGCERVYLKKGLDNIELNNSAQNELLVSSLLRLSELEAGSVDESLKYINQALVKVDEEPSLEHWKPSLIFNKSQLYYKNTQMNKAEATLVEAVESSFVQNVEMSTLYQKELLNFYYAIGKKDRALEVVKIWVKNEKYFPSNSEVLQDQFLYMAAWVLIDVEPNQALEVLEKITPSNNVDKVELHLAKILASEAASRKVPESRETTMSLINKVTENYEWFSMFRYVESDSFLDNDEWQNLDNNWQQRISELLRKDDYQFVFEKINSIYNQYNEDAPKF